MRRATGLPARQCNSHTDTLYLRARLGAPMREHSAAFETTDNERSKGVKNAKRKMSNEKCSTALPTYAGSCPPSNACCSDPGSSNVINGLRWGMLAVLILGAGCATAPFKAGAPEGALDVIAHRGASAYAPENTLAAFELAAEQGADWFELDCTLSKDNAIIVIHDSDLERTTNLSEEIPVASMTLAQLKELDAGSWFSPEFAGEALPTLEEALDFAKRRIGVYVEIKNSDDDDALIQAMLETVGGQTEMTPALRQQLMELIEESGTRNLELTRRCIAAIRERKMREQVVIQSFSPVVCLVALTEAPKLRIEFLGAEDEDHPERWGQFVAFGNLISVDGFNVDHESLNEERLAAFHNAGKTVAVWTVDDPVAMRRYARLGVDAIITNKPGLCLRVLDDIGKR